MTTATIVGRGAQLRAIRETVDRAPRQGGGVVIVGDPGIGKSTILQAAVAEARGAGMQVLDTAGVEAEAQLPFAGLHQLLRPVLPAMDALPSVQRHALGSALGAEDGPVPDPFLIAMAALGLLTEAAARQPLVIAVDDVHWLDRPSHEALAFVARRVAQDPIVVLATVRTGYPGPLLTAGLSSLPVGDLDDAAARDLLDVTAADLGPADRERILRESLGNPLALVELPIAWRGAHKPPADGLPVTARLERAFAGRADELPPDVRDSVLVAAVESVDDLAEILAAASHLAGRPIGVGIFDEAVAAGLLRFDAARLTFRHPLVRSGVLAAETLTRRQAAHAAVAAVLTGQPYRRALHRAQAVIGPDDEVADELADNHAVALRRGSVTSAIWGLERSAQLTSDPVRRGQRLLLAAEHAFGLGRADIVNRLVAEAARVPLPRLDQARAEWLREIFDDGVPGDADRVLELAGLATEAGAAGDIDLAHNLLLGAALRCWWADAGPRAGALTAEVARRIPGPADDPRLIAVLAVAQPVAQCATVVDRLARIPAETVDEPNYLRLLGMAAHAVGDCGRSVDYLMRAEYTLRRQGRLALLSQVLTMQVLDHVDMGDWIRAEAAVREGERLAHDTGQPIWNAGSLVLGAIVAGIRGDNERAQSMAARVEHLIHGQRLNDLRACVQLARGFGWISVGDHQLAYEALRRLFDSADVAFHQTERYHGLMCLAEAAVHTGHRREARAVVDELTDLARTTPSATLRVQLHYARAVLADDADAEQLFTAAPPEDLSRWPWPRARLQLAYGSWLRRRRRVVESREPLREAQATFAAIGARRWTELTAVELRATGEQVSDDHTPAAYEVLSGQELQIARMAAQGLSNKEIGQRLFLSPRTVSSHLYRIFPKLGVSSRVQLAARTDLG